MVQGGVSYVDNKTTQYIGYRLELSGSPNDYKYIKTPCFIDLTRQEPGCYSLQYESVFDDQTARYLVSHPKLTWIRNDLKNLKNVPSVISITSESNGIISDRYFFGRTLDEGNYRFGRFVADERNYYLLLPLEKGTDYVFTTNVEIQACAPIIDAPCGNKLAMLVFYINVNTFIL